MARNGLISLAAGFGSGYLGAKRQMEEDADRKEERQIRLVDAHYNQEQRQRQRDLDVSLANAARPVGVEEGAGGAVRLPTADDRDVDGTPGTISLAGAYRVGGKTFNDRASADAAAAAQNAPEAIALRQAGVYTAAGRPGEGIALANTAQAQQAARVKAAREQAEYARKLEEEGAFAVGKAMLTGDPQAVFQAMNAGGNLKMEAPPQVREVEIDVPGIGKRKDFIFSGTIVGADGVKRQYERSAYQTNLGLVPFEKQLEILRKGTESDSRAQLRLDQAEAMAKRAEAAGMMAEARVLRAQASGAGGGDKVSREERLRWTSLHSESGRRLSEANKTLAKLQADPAFMRKAGQEGTPQAGELAALKQEISEYKGDREMYGSLLAGSQGKAAREEREAAKPPPGGKPAGTPKATASMPAPTSKAEYDALPSGTKYRHPDGTVKVKG